MLNNYRIFVAKSKNINEMAAPRIPNSTDYWEKKGKKGRYVMIYTHDDMDGIFSAIAIKKYLKDKGFNIIGYGIINYQEGWDVFNIDKEVINVAVDFAEMHPDIDVYIDHHGEFIEGDETDEASKKIGAIKTKTGSAYEGIMDQLGLPIDSLILDVIDMIDSAKYDHYKVKWTDILDFDLEKIKNTPKSKLLFASVFNQLLKRGDYRTIIEVIHNVDEPSIYKIFNYIKKLSPGNNPWLKRPITEDDIDFTDPDYQGKEFVDDGSYRIGQMKSRTRGGSEFKGVLHSQKEFMEHYLTTISYPEDSRSKFAGQEANVIKLDGYCIIGDCAFVGSGTWANALRARAIIQQDIESGRLPEEAKRIKWVFLQYGDTLQVCSYGNVGDYEDYELPKTKSGQPINDLKKFCIDLLNNFKTNMGFSNNDTLAGGHPGIGTISNIGVSEFNTMYTDEKTKYMAGLRYLDLFKNYIIKSLSKVPWRLDLSWENPFSNTRIEEPVPVDARVMKLDQIREVDHKTGKITYPKDYVRKEPMNVLKKNAAKLKQLEKELEEQNKQDTIEKAKARHTYYQNHKEGEPNYEEWTEDQKNTQIELKKLNNLTDTLKTGSEIKFTDKDTIKNGIIKDASDVEILVEDPDSNMIKVNLKGLLDDKNFEIIKENISSIFNIKYTYKDGVKSALLNIIMEEEHISEKAFKLVDEKLKFIKDLFTNNKQIESIINECEAQDKRYKYCAEFIYENVIKNND
jgi:hypothetical protein